MVEGSSSPRAWTKRMNADDQHTLFEGEFIGTVMKTH
jgi:hypothetical protein